jgi:transposase-like protein
MAHQNGKRAEVEVQPRATRRTFSVEYKRRILTEADICPRGQVGALLRREGLYYSHLTKWRGEREAGTLADRGRGPKANPDRAQVDRLARENAALKRKLEQAEAIIAAQKKLARLLDSRENERL